MLSNWLLEDQPMLPWTGHGEPSGGLVIAVAIALPIGLELEGAGVPLGWLTGYPRDWRIGQVPLALPWAG